MRCIRGRPLCVFCGGFVIVLFLLLTLLQIPHYNVPTWEGQQVRVTGMVTDLGYRNEKLQIFLKSVIISDGASFTQLKENIGGVCYVSEAEGVPGIGSTVKLKGTFYNFQEATNEGQFDTARYYQIRGVDFMLTGATIVDIGRERVTAGQLLFVIKKYFGRVFDKYFSAKEAGILKAMLLGDRDYLDSDTKELFQRAGISHLLAISGTHVGIIGVALYGLLKKLLRSWKGAALVSSFILISYCLMTGFGASTERAMIMYALSLLADVIGRAYDLATALAASAIISLCINPLLIYDAGFILSFGAVMGVALVYPVLIKATENFLPKGVRGSLVSLAITIFTLPFTLFFFYRFPVYSLILNLILIPMVGVLIICALICALVGGITGVSVLALALSIPCKVILEIYLAACKLTEKLPGNIYIAGKPELWRMAIYYILLILALVLLQKNRRRRLMGAGIIVAAILSLFVRFNFGTQITMLDVGQGLCMALRSCEHCVIFDGGSTDISEVGKYRIIPFLEAKGINVVDIILVSHTDADHINGIKELIERGKLEGIKIKRLGMSQVSLDSDKGRELAVLAENNGIKVIGISAGDEIREGKMKLLCLYPGSDKGGDVNELSMTLQLTYGNFKMLLTGDVEGEGEERLIELFSEYPVEETVFQVAHHGSKGSNSEKLLSKIKPAISIVSAGKNNTYGHPHKETIDRLLKMDSRIYVTREVGAITVSTDGEKQKLETFIK